MDKGSRPMILVTGCGRSGTSLTAQVLKACGANLGQHNELYEHLGVRERVLKPYLESIGADPLGQDPLPEETPITGTWADRVAKHLDGDTYKDAKIALMWRVWADAYPSANWVLCWRDPDDIAASCLRTRFMRAYDTHADWADWAERYQAYMAAIDADTVDVWPDDAIYDPEVYRPVVEHCGLTWDREAVEAVIEPNNWHA